MTPRPPLDLEDARRRLRELGYLRGRVERFVFARALQGRGGLFLPAVLLGAFAAAMACLAAVAAGEPAFLERAAAPAALLSHLFFAFLAPAALLALLAGFAADRARAPVPIAMALAAAAALGVFFLWIAGAWRLARGIPETALLWGVPVAIAALVAARGVRSGFLARAYARSGELPANAGRGALFGVAAAGLLVAAGVFASRGGPAAVPALHVSARRPPIVVVAVDGVGGSGTDANAGGPLETLLARGATGWWPSDAASPPELWSTVATGAPASRHGVRALERVRPAGSPTALRPPLGSSWYLRRVAPALGLAASAPVSDADRAALAFWEVSASAGLPSAAIGWWASGPWPGADVVNNRQVLARAATGEEADAVALEELSRRSGASISTAYLPGPDILRAEPSRRAAEIARIADFLERHIRQAAEAGGESVLVVLTADSHAGATGSSLGRATVFDGRPHASIRIRAEDVAPSILARAGIPAAEDLPGRPVPVLFRDGSLEKLTVPTYGPRIAPSAPASPTSDKDYLKKLKSLGYLN